LERFLNMVLLLANFFCFACFSPVLASYSLLGNGAFRSIFTVPLEPQILFATISRCSSDG